MNPLLSHSDKLIIDFNNRFIGGVIKAKYLQVGDKNGQRNRI